MNLFFGALVTLGKGSGIREGDKSGAGQSVGAPGLLDGEQTLGWSCKTWLFVQTVLPLPLLSLSLATATCCSSCTVCRHLLTERPRRTSACLPDDVAGLEEVCFGGLFRVCCDNDAQCCETEACVAERGGRQPGLVGVSLAKR